MGTQQLALNRLYQQQDRQQNMGDQLAMDNLKQLDQAIAGIQSNPYLSTDEKTGRIRAAQAEKLKWMSPLIGKQRVNQILQANPDLAQFKPQTGTVPAEQGTPISVGGDLQQLAARTPQLSPKQLAAEGVDVNNPPARVEGTDFSQIPNVQPTPVQMPAKGPTQVSLTPPTTADVIASGAPSYVPFTDAYGNRFMIPSTGGVPLIRQAMANQGRMLTTQAQIEGRSDEGDKNRALKASEGAANRETRTDIAKMNQGAPVTIPPELAQAVGMPEFGGQQVGKATMGNIAKLATTLGFQYKDIGAHRWLVNKMGDKLVDMGPTPASVQPGISAQYRPFQTSDSEGQPTTISAAEAIRTGAPAIQTWNTVFGPTTQTKAQAQAAGAVAEHIPAFKQAVQNLEAKGELGPVMGRLNTFLTEGYGGSDPDIAEFVTTVGLLKTGAVRAHFGARGGSNVLHTFDNYLNSGMTGPALMGSIDAIGSFLNTYKEAGVPKPPKNPTIPAKNPPPSPPAQAAPNPTRMVQFSPSTKQYRHSDDGGKTWLPGQ